MGLWCVCSPRCVTIHFGYKSQEPNSNWLKYKKDFMGSQSCRVQGCVCPQMQPDSEAQPRPARPGLPMLSSAFLQLCQFHSDSLHECTPRTSVFHPTVQRPWRKRGPTPKGFMPIPALTLIDQFGVR